MTAEVVRLPVVLRPGRYWQDLTEAQLDEWEPWLEHEVAMGRAKLLRLASTLGEKDWWCLFHVLERGAPYPIEAPEPSPRRILVVEPPPKAQQRRPVKLRSLPNPNRLAVRALTLSSVAVLHFLARSH